MKNLIILTIIFTSLSGCSAFNEGWNRGLMQSEMESCDLLPTNKLVEKCKVDIYTKYNPDSSLENPVEEAKPKLMTNGLLKWPDGTTERIYFSPSHRAVTIFINEDTVILTINESTIGADCLEYVATINSNNLSLKFCYGSEVLFYSSNGVKASGEYITDSGFNISPKKAKSSTQNRISGKAEAMYNSTLAWDTGVTERAFVSPSNRTISHYIEESGQNLVFTVDEATIGNDCPRYHAKILKNNNLVNIEAFVCFGSEVSSYAITAAGERIALSAGVIIKDDKSSVIPKSTSELEQERNKIATQKAKVLADNELEKEHKYRRVEAETKAIEAHGSKESEKIDAVNDAIRSVGKGFENHGIK
ncbi:hypothetical protein MSG37_19140 [Shewanella sp. 1CM18E]|uniref:hypothetical protein n=1 Tax=Shewanella sp. 1CM18E TaxID=2929169 RepID=UPI0020BDE7A0|nr:hypothetical protein [Shewanella sp. 1CM18E]MCK8047008.1 hypothetical protein [Shewanella sp. 1CM18E]